MKPIELSETGRIEIPLSAELGQQLIDSEIVKATRHGARWTIAGRRGFVGAARVGDLEVWVAPKLSVARLLFLAGYAKSSGKWHDDTVDLDPQQGLVPAIAQMLWRQCDRVLRQGLLQGYRTVDESSNVLRGRLREADQLRRHNGRAIPMEITHDDFTVDIPENQILLAAISRMLAVPRVDDESQRRLTAIRTRLTPTTTMIKGPQLPAWQPTRLNQRYHTVLKLAEVIWRATSPEHSQGTVSANGFLFNLEKIFEDFVTTAIGEKLRERFGGTAHAPYPCWLDQARTVKIKPDLVWMLDGKPAAVVDAKYKQEKKSGYPDADLYQMLAYCTSLGLQRGHLVYAEGTAMRHVVRHSGIEIVCHALDLDQQPDPLLAQVDQIVDDLTK